MRYLHHTYMYMFFLPFTLQVDEVRGSIEVQPPNQTHGEPPKKFTFDIVFGQQSKQVDIYNQAARPIVDFVLEGYNGMLKHILKGVLSL